MRKENFGSYILLLTIGTLLIVFHEKISHILPYIIGGLTILISIGFLKDSFQSEELKKSETKKMATGLVMFIMAIIIIINKTDSINLIAVIWGMFGLIKGIDELSDAIYKHSQNKKYLIELIHAVIEISLAVLLIYNPFEKISEHIIILGIEYVMLSLQIIINPKMVERKRKHFLFKKAKIN